MSTAAEKATERWLTCAAAARLAGVSRATVARWGNEALIGTRQLPFTRRLYRAPDVERLAAESVKPAR